MKKTTFTLLIALFLWNNLNSQVIQFAVNSTYFVSAPNSFSGQNQEMVYPDEMTVSSLRGNLGSGLNLGIQCNKSVNEAKNIFLCLNFSYFKGNKLLFQHYDMNQIYQNTSGNANQIRLNPGICFSLAQKKITFAIETGLLIPLSSSSEFQVIDFDYNTSTFIEKNLINKYNFAFGYTNQLSAQMNLSKHLKINTSLNLILFSQSLKSTSTSAYSLNNNDVLSSSSTYDLETKYKQNLSNFSNNLAYNSFTNTSLPKDELIHSHNFSSLGFGIGIIYQFDVDEIKKNKKSQ